MKKIYFVVVVIFLLGMLIFSCTNQSPVESPVNRLDKIGDSAMYAEGIGEDGCSHGYWKNHQNAWPEEYDPNTTCLGDVFTFPPGFDYSDLAEDLLLDALDYKGGKGSLGAARIMLRQSVAALLNAAHPSVNYPRDETWIALYVNYRLAWDNRDEMLWLADVFDFWNNQYCPLS